MAPKRGKKATAVAATAIEPVADSADNGSNDAAQVNNKPAKADTKKTKTAKNAKQTEQNGASEEVAVSSKANSKSKKTTAPAKKNAKQTEPAEQNGGNIDDKIVVPVKAETKSRKAAGKKNVQQIEQASGSDENGLSDAIPKTSKKAAKGKPKEEELPKVQVTKATKGRSKKAEPVQEPDTTNTDNNKKVKAKPAKKGELKEEVVENVPEPKNKRGAKKEKLPAKQKPIDKKKAAKGTAKNADIAKSKAPKEEEEEEPTSDKVDNAQENNDADTAKGRKRKPVKADNASPAKKPKVESATASGSTVKSPQSKANGESKKRKAVADSTTTNEGDGADELVTKRKKATKDEAKKEPKAKMNQTATNYSAINFDSDKEFGLKIVSWNVAGLRALVTKDGFDYFDYEKPDIICLQEIKCLEDEVPEKAKLKGYHPYWCSTEGGRGGVAIFSKQMPYNVEKNIGDAEMDEEGRIITAEYSKFYLVCVYVPNAGRGLVNLDRRLRWNKMFEEHVTKLKKTKPVVICGDMNVAHEEIDLANPKTNKKNAGFSPEERAGMTDLLSLGFIDTFRDLYPDQSKAYTFWTYMGGARAKNVGWRLDYCLVSDSLKSKVVDSFMRPQILGSDHCPIVLLLKN